MWVWGGHLGKGGRTHGDPVGSRAAELGLQGGTATFENHTLSQHPSK